MGKERVKGRESESEGENKRGLRVGERDTDRHFSIIMENTAFSEHKGMYVIQWYRKSCRQTFEYTENIEIYFKRIERNRKLHYNGSSKRSRLEKKWKKN